MSSAVLSESEIDFIEELRLRRWARENHCPRANRKDSWHPVVHEEMDKKDLEGSDSPAAPAYAWSDS